MFTQTITDVHEIPVTVLQRVLNVVRRFLGRPVVAPGLVIVADVSIESPKLLPAPKQSATRG
jgi:hypothetical protein